ncbi:hypothetical protein DDT54_07745 [Brenneria nigrifluens DSM 30175 = ATCC 13028]|nr:hypothetical protein DDT54_07745 [Brenneria nigrifluens DSM 30175 = ATCC 13028]
MLWEALLGSLTQDDKNILLNYAFTNGISSLLPFKTSEHVLKIAQLIDALPSDDLREILHLIEAKKLGALLDSTQGRKHGQPESHDHGTTLAMPAGTLRRISQATKRCSSPTQFRQT